MNVATPVYFGPADRPLFGWVHQPAGRAARGTAVLCAPVHREYISAHATYRVLAERLAERGVTAIRFDYDGTGDSAGSGADPRRTEAYEDSVDHALALADALGGSSPDAGTGREGLVLVGMRMGGLLAARAAARLGRPVSLVLWDPCKSGREFLREQSALFRLTYGKATAAQGETEVAGFVLSAETVASLGALRAPEANPSVTRALVLTRPDRPAAGAFGIDESRISNGVAEGQAELLDTEPFFSRIPPVVGTVAQWIDAALPTVRTTQQAPPRRDEMLVRAPAGTHTVRERLLRLGSGKLFAVATTGEGEAVGPWIVFLTSGNESHIGPNRMWVDLARDWAGLGLRCVRFDLSGLGDSPTRPGRPRRVERAPEAFWDVEEVVDALGGPRPADGRAPAVLVGLCSGGYQALDSALDLHTAGAIAINPVFRFPPPELKSGALEPRRTLVRPVDESLRTAYNKLPDWKVVRLARAGYMAANRWRSRRRTTAAWLAELSARGTDVLCICGRLEADALFEGAPQPEGPHAVVAPNAVVEIVEDLDHGLIPESSRRLVADMMTTHVLERFAGAAGAAGATPVRAGAGVAP